MVMGQECLSVSPKTDDLFDLMPFVMNCINSTLSAIVFTVVFIFTEFHKILKDHSYQVKASIQNLHQALQNNTLLLFMQSPVIENICKD